MIRRGSAHRLHAARTAWLRPRLARVADVPGIHEDVTDANRPALEALHAEMKAAGLFGATTPTMQREALRRLLTELRGSALPEPLW